MQSEDEEDVKLLSVSGKRSTCVIGNKFPQKIVKLAADEDDQDEDKDNNNDDFDDGKAEEKAPIKKICMIYSQKCTKIKSELKRLKINTKIKRS